MASFTAMLKWMRDVERDARREPVTHCPNDGTRLQPVRGVMWCPFDGWTDRGWRQW